MEEDEYTQKARGHGAETIVAPEVIVGLKWDLKADIWSVGASVSGPIPDVVNIQIFELLTNQALVNPSFGRKESIFRDMIMTCGPCTENLKQSNQVKEIIQSFGCALFFLC